MVQKKKKTMFDLDEEDEDDFVKIDKVQTKKKTGMPNILEEEEDDEFVPAQL